MLFNTSTIEIQNLRISVQWSRWDLNPQPAFTGYTIQRGRLANQELQLINQPLRDNNKEKKMHSLIYRIKNFQVVVLNITLWTFFY